MKIALLARNPKLYSHRRICEAARARGHEIEVVNTLRVSINITSKRPALYYRKRRIEDFDAVIPRIGASVTFYGLAVLRQFEVMGIYPLNESVAIGRSRDKLRCLQLLARRGIGLPTTAFTNDPKQAEDVIDLVGGAGRHQAARRHTRHRRNARRDAEIGEVGDRGVPGRERQHPGAGVHQEAGSTTSARSSSARRSWRRSSARPPGEFRSNLHRGGIGEKVKITPQERATAVKAARTLGLNVCGVDMLRSRDGPLVVEVNSSPGIEGLEKATGVDVAGLMIGFLERNAPRGNTRTKGKG
jgi:ribosomal protein S6--L-glutamate ligase